MLIIPAIDLLGGKVVRLEKGDMDKFKVYSNDPVEVAKRFEEYGVSRLHVVDLDGAKKGDTVNYHIIESIVKNTSLSLDVGGGIRSIEKCDQYLGLGVDYVVLGTAVIKNPEFTKEALKKYPGKIILGIDAKDGYVATDGWYEKSDLTAVDVVKIYEGFDVAAIIYTDISRDGMLTGVNVDATVHLSRQTKQKIIASGGVKGEEDIFELARFGIYGCIIGKAYYEGRLDIKKILEKMK
ncbi:MAG: 1-(5-phosphoribosyl)-5-[(5-phosphoribosylamino)methylideneamino]imidazole-4-carboxamide isomerase [Calditerrivibrio sp.]|nr:1-(5-phosphoribosyl)-5-[(5-phosphoribosylamino)methylideneamino]imidazole-4-carboxamide isomerase [Calditerrivibrio sp.]